MNRFAIRFVLSTLLVWTVTTAGSFAGPPAVQFDVRSVVECRDVTTAEFAATNPDERLVEARFQVSTLIQHGNADDLIQYLYRIESRQGTAQVVDYQPKTTLATDIIGNLGIENKREDAKSLGVTVSGPTAGQWIATAGVHYLRDGQVVRLIDESVPQ